jgi:integrase
MKIKMKYLDKIGSYHYYRRGGKRWRLKGEPGSRGFLEDWRDAEADYLGATPFGVKESFNEVADKYLTSPEFKDLAAGSQKNYRIYLKQMRRSFGPSPILDIKRKHVKAYRDRIADKRGAANQSVRVMMAVMAWAIDSDLIEINPAAGIKGLKGGEFLPWPDTLIERFFKEAPKELVWAFAVGLYTGQRKGDVLKVRWADIENGGINFRQQKTGVEIWVPILPELETVIKSIPKRSLHILTTKTGRVWVKSNFDSTFKRCLKDMGIGGYVFHGLRKNAAVMLAEAGCTTEQIKAWTGHASDSMAAYYSRGANQKHLANAAKAKVLKSAK